MGARNDTALIEAFLRERGATKCPTAFVAPTVNNRGLGEQDRQRLRQHDEGREASAARRREERAGQLGGIAGAAA